MGKKEEEKVRRKRVGLIVGIDEDRQRLRLCTTLARLQRSLCKKGLSNAQDTSTDIKHLKTMTEIKRHAK